MDQLLIQRTRYLLKARFRQSLSCPDVIFTDACHQLFDWINNHPLLKHIFNDLGKIEGAHLIQIKNIINEATDKNIRGEIDPGMYSAATKATHNSVCFNILKEIAGINTLDKFQKDLVVRCFGEYLNGDNFIKTDEAVSVLREVVLESLFEYLDENLDDRNSIYFILTKYKQRSEWFRKNRLRDFAENGLENVQGEKALVVDVKEYVLDQGVEFFVEPTSASGEPDIIIKSPDGSYIVIEAKYIKENSDRSDILTKMASGFHQTYRYCNDFNVGCGFLVNFVADKKRISIDLEIQDGIPFLQIGNKTVYYIEVVIADEPSASKSGKAVEVTIKKEELKDTIDNIENEN